MTCVAVPCRLSHKTASVSYLFQLWLYMQDLPVDLPVDGMVHNRCKSLGSRCAAEAPQHHMLCVQLGWRGERVMESRYSVLDVPGARRRMLRWRSWWNKNELYPPSVDEWFARRRLFHERERKHAVAWVAGQAAGRGQTKATSLQSNERHTSGLMDSLMGALRLAQRGAICVFCDPLSCLSGQSRFT